MVFILLRMLGILAVGNNEYKLIFSMLFYKNKIKLSITNICLYLDADS